MHLTERDFQMNVTGKFSREIISQCQEGVAISKALEAVKKGQGLVLLNVKSEFFQPWVETRQFAGLPG